MMNKIFYALVACIVLASCSSAYRSSQTPDDVYYSPGHSKTVASAQAGQDDYLTYDDEDDNYLRMKVQNRNRWSSLDDYSYWNSPYYSSSFGFNYGGYYSPYVYSPFNSFGYSPYGYSPLSLSLFYSPFGYNYYNPWGSYYYSPTYVYYGKPGSNSGYYARPQNRSSLNGYTNRNYNYGNSSLPVRNSRRSGLSTDGSNTYNSYNSQGNRNTYNNTNSNRSYNNNSNSNINRNNTNNTNSNPVRTFNNSSSGSRSISGGSSGGSVSRPVRH